MPTRTADAEWQGNLQQGKGTMHVGSGAFEGNYSFKSRFGDETTGTNPEELLGAAHAGCYSMALSNALATAGFTPTSVRTTARVHFNTGAGGISINPIDLETQAVVPGLDDETFQKLARDAKENCPVSKALASVPINLKATLSK
ncbi:MAG: OsmC family protein [Ktedonobacteraceae bacterium]|nr:OsmC family protein [Ktedonobacteraceae bacterium]